MKTNFLLVLTFIGGLFWTQAQETVPRKLSLQQAINYTLENNYNFQRASNEIRIAEKRVWEETSAGLPQINGSVDYQNNVKQPIILFPDGDGGFTPITFGTKQTAMGMIELKQLLFDGTYVVGVQGIKHFLDIANNVQEKTQLEIQRIIVDAYLGAIAAQANVTVLDENINTLSKNVEEVHQLFRSGFGEEESVEQLEITLLDLETQNSR